MARQMAFALAVLVIVPVVAPALGAGLIKFMPWRGTFVICAVFGVAIAAWSLTLPETLAVEPVGHVAATAAAVYATVRRRLARSSVNDSTRPSTAPSSRSAWPLQ